MELSAELFETTLHRIKGDGGTGGVERRVTPRVGLRSRIKLFPVKDTHMAGEAVEVWTRDISRTGVGVMSSKRMKVGDHFLLTLASPTPEGRIILYCTVRNCQPLVRGIFAVGLSFESLRGGLSPEETHHSTKPAAAAPEPTRMQTHAA